MDGGRYPKRDHEKEAWGPEKGGHADKEMKKPGLEWGKTSSISRKIA